MKKEHFYNLLDKYLNENITASEEKELLSLLNDPEYAKLLQEHVAQKWRETNTSYDETLAESVRNKVFNKINEDQPAPEPLHRIRVWRWVAAASIIMLLITGLVYYQKSNYKQPAIISANETKDINAPESEKLLLTLGDGRTIVLNNTLAGEIAKEGSSQIIKAKDGSITYTDGRPGIETIYNTLTVPRGSKVVTLTLHDGTKVWLNAESSLHFPVVFSNGMRKVTLTGEGYFEVTKDAKRKFIVEALNSRTEVLGTHFNVNAYRNEDGVHVSLLEGKVQVNNGASARLLNPGEQASVKDRSVEIKTDVDMEVVMAWKNGMFNFNNTSLTSIMQQVSRWYNVEVEYSGVAKTLNFGGKISRRKNVSSILELLEMTGVVKFRIETSQQGYDGKIIVEYK